MRKRTTEYFEELEKCDMSQELKCVNALQNTPWQINRKVLEVLREAWDSGQEYGGLPPREDLPLPVYPFDCEPSELTPAQQEEFKKFRKDRGAVHEHNNRTMSLRILIERTIQVAESYAEREEFYYVWQLDFRARKYPMESFLSPQAGDASKALLTFAFGCHINTPEDAKWLAIHGANCFGNDKISLDDRELFAYMNTEMAQEIAENPFGSMLWLDADKPWQFLAWCFEWAGYIECRDRGEPFVTTLPCSADGSCNGLQHLSAILRDREGGKSVNLTKSLLPQDIYNDVAIKAMERIRKDAHTTNNPMAHQCLHFGITRKETKRSVMIVPYSGTRYSCREYVLEALKERIAKTGINPWGDELYLAANYMAEHIWEAISESISSARVVMDYIRSVAEVYAKHQKVMQWYTPTGMLVWQCYHEMNRRRIKTAINGSVVKLNYHSPIDDTVSRSKTLSGASPNMIHSLDAAALTMTVNRCLDEGIEDFAMVHDSYGTQSPRMNTMSKILRECFVDMYESNDVLQQLYDHAVKVLPDGVEIPKPPEKGDLSLQEVLQSEYFFS